MVNMKCRFPFRLAIKTLCTLNFRQKMPVPFMFSDRNVPSYFFHIVSAVCEYNFAGTTMPSLKL